MFNPLITWPLVMFACIRMVGGAAALDSFHRVATPIPVADVSTWSHQTGVFWEWIDGDRLLAYRMPPQQRYIDQYAFFTLDVLRNVERPLPRLSRALLHGQSPPPGSWPPKLDGLPYWAGSLSASSDGAFLLADTVGGVVTTTADGRRSATTQCPDAYCAGWIGRTHRWAALVLGPGVRGRIEHFVRLDVHDADRPGVRKTYALNVPIDCGAGYFAVDVRPAGRRFRVSVLYPSETAGGRLNTVVSIAGGPGTSIMKRLWARNERSGLEAPDGGIPTFPGVVFSPSGDRLAWANTTQTSGRADAVTIWTSRIDGSGRRAVCRFHMPGTQFPGAGVLRVRWRPGGKWLSFVALDRLWLVPTGRRFTVRWPARRLPTGKRVLPASAGAVPARLRLRGALCTWAYGRSYQLTSEQRCAGAASTFAWNTSFTYDLRHEVARMIVAQAAA